MLIVLRLALGFLVLGCCLGMVSRAGFGICGFWSVRNGGAFTIERLARLDAGDRRRWRRSGLCVSPALRLR